MNDNLECVFRNGIVVNYKLNSTSIEIKANIYAPKISLFIKDTKHASRELKIATEKAVNMATSI